MYKNRTVRLKIGKADTTIPFEVGVKQGNIMASILFLFLIMGFAETLEKMGKTDCINYNSAATKIHHSHQAVSPVT